ncbi:MAG: LytTR family DNA-binding domain-containing protein [Prolixibacteraceae bacterium]
MKQSIANEKWLASQKEINPLLHVSYLKAGEPASNLHRKFIPITEAGGIERIELTQISYIIVDGDCCIFYLDDQEHRSCSKSLKSLHKSLPTAFIRINRNCLVNSLKIKKLITKERKVILFNGEELIVSFRSLALLKERLSQDL